MKRSVLLILTTIFLIGSGASAQGILKKVSKSMTDELLGKKPSVPSVPSVPGGQHKYSNQPEPSCACNQADVVMDMGGKLQLDYSELSISISDDGRILAKDLHADSYYIVQDGATTGPFKPGDKKLKGFESIMRHDTDYDADSDSESDTEENPWEGNQYITKSGEKFLITFDGKSYGPYGYISGFEVPKSGDKFAALVTENIVVSKSEGEAMEEAMKNAKTDQEKMDLAMKYGQQMQERMMQGGGPASMMTKIVSNIPDVSSDMMQAPNGVLKGSVKFDDIVFVCFDKIVDLKRNTIIAINQAAFGSEKLFLNSSNTKYAYYNSGTLTFSDNTTPLAELFNPSLIKSDGKVYLAYMYYSPKKNSIMQCKLPF